MLSVYSNEDRSPTLTLAGTIEGADLKDLRDALRTAMHQPGRTVLVDVSGVRSWSLLAQAMLLSTAKRLADNGGQLVLYRPSEALRRQSMQMGLFDRVSTTPPPDLDRGLGGPASG